LGETFIFYRPCARCQTPCYRPTMRSGSVLL
jgi:hypothetical protein